MIALHRIADARGISRAIAEEIWSERAAIREYLGGFERAEAERLAVEDACAIVGAM